MTELVRYEAARRALAEAVAVDDVTEIRSKAEAMRIYAQQAGDKELEIQAAQIRFRAEVRLGELLIAAKYAGQIREGRPKIRSDREQFGAIDGGALEAAEAAFDEYRAASPFRVTLEQAGIDRKLSSRAQRMAQMDAAELEQALARHAEEMRAGVGRVAMDLLKIGAEEKGRAHRRDLAVALSEKTAELPSGQKFPAVYLDPPWQRQGGIGDRAYENHYPTMAWPDILDYLRQVRDRLLPDAWAFMWIPRAHLLAPVELERELQVKATGELVVVADRVPLAWACQIALGCQAYSTCFVWTKTDADHPDVSGSGLIARDQDELLLLYKRGQGLPKPEAGEKFGSNHRERPREHSRKPEFYRQMIATMVGCDSAGQPLPVLELFARVDAENPLPANWRAAGNQAGAPAIEIDDYPREGASGTAREAPSTLCEREPGEPLVRAAGLDVGTQSAPPHDLVFAAGLPSDAGETVAAAADATRMGASPVAAVTGIPVNPEDVDEYLALKLLSDFCHPRRAELADIVGPHYLARGLAYQSGAHWSLREAGWHRLGEIEPPRPAPVGLTEPYQAPPKPQLSLDLALPDAPAPLVVDGKLQTRLPVDDDELDEQLALLEIAAGNRIEGEMLRHLVGKGFAHCGITKISVTDEGRAFLAQLVTPGSVQQQGANGQ